MTTFAIERQPNQHVFRSPKWVDVLAKAYLFLVAIFCWLKLNQSRLEVYLLTRLDLARRHIGPIPPAHWRLGYAFTSMILFLLWQEVLISGSAKIWGSICLG